jgi:hypothetical protein
MLPGRRGRTPTRIARLLTRPRQLTRAMSDSHRAATPTRLPTGTSTQLQLLSGLNPGSPHRCQPRPAIMPPSLSHLQQSRDCPIAEKRRWFSFNGAENAQNDGDQRRPSAGRCIAWFGVLQASHALARSAMAGSISGQSWSVAGSKSAPLGQTRV